jgi:hypothetical protein
MTDYSPFLKPVLYLYDLRHSDIRLSNLTPLVPLSFKGEGEDKKKRGYAPLTLPQSS